MNYKVYLGLLDQPHGRTVYFCPFPSCPGNTVATGHHIAHVNETHVAVVTFRA
jgi:hypothetical protein